MCVCVCCAEPFSQMPSYQLSDPKTLQRIKLLPNVACPGVVAIMLTPFESTPVYELGGWGGLQKWSDSSLNPRTAPNNKLGLINIRGQH